MHRPSSSYIVIVYFRAFHCCCYDRNVEIIRLHRSNEAGKGLGGGGWMSVERLHARQSSRLTNFHSPGAGVQDMEVQ